MRKLLTILLLFAACALKAQYTPNSGAYSYKGLMPLKSLQLPTDCGYPVTAIHAPDSSRSAIYFDSCDALLYRFDPQPKTWSIVGGTGIDSLFITNTDSIFIISGGDTIFVGINDDGCTNGIKQPGYVTWSGDGLTFDVTAGFFTLDCTLYDGNAGSITLDPADPTFPRFDVIGWDTTGAVIKVTGTAGMNPAIPQVDPSYQIGLTVINIPAGATVPGGITQDVIYDENNEDWTGAVSGITVNLDNTTNPYHLTKSADAGTWSPAPKTLTFTNDTGYIDANDYGILKLFISLKESIATVGNIRVSFLNDGDAVSNIVSLGGGVGFNKSIADTYQNISVPLSSFIFTSTVFNQVRITFAGSGDGAYIDYIQLQGGITPPSIAGVYQDTTYSRNDSLFGRKNNAEFFIQHLTLARLPQLWGVYINNDDSTYDPYGVDVGIGVDSALLKDWIINTVIDNDTTITTVLDDLDYVVDTISNDPPVGVAEGYKVLVGTSPTGDFAGHENEIATLVGSVWTFEVPAANETLEVHNSTQLLFYKFTGVDWILQAVPALIGGNTGLVEPDIGTTDANSFTIKTDNIDAIVIDTLQNVKLPMFANLEDSNLYYRPGVDGKFDTAYFNELIAGTGITITPGPNRTDTIKSTGGGGSVTVAAGGKSDIDSNLVYDGGMFKKASPLGYINIMDYGAVPDSSTDNSGAFTAAILAAPIGGIILVPTGNFKCISEIVVDKPITFQGSGSGSYPDFEWVPSATKVFTTDPTINLFRTTVKNVKFYDMTIQNLATTPTAGAGIYGEEGHGMQVQRCMITGFYNLVKFLNAGEWTIADSYLTGMVNAAVVVRDSITPDDGDWAMVNNIIAARTRNANYGILWLSSGGGRILNNKFNWGYEGTRIGWPIYCAFTDGQTGNGHIANNSFENYTENAIFIDPGPSNDFVGNLTIVGNQFQNLYAPSVKADIKLMTTMIGVTIMGNVFSTSTGADTAIYFDFNIFKIACANSYQGYDIPVIYGTNSVNSVFDNNTIAQSTQMGVASYSPTATPLNLSMGGTLYNNNTPVNTGLKLRLYNDGTDANNSGFGVTGNSTFNMFSWAANGWGNIMYVNNGTEAFRAKSTGIIQMAQYGAGTATFDASGNISSVSDERVKRNIHPYRTGLRELMKINPISFQYNGLSGNEVNGTYAGFSAQNVGANIPNSTGTTADGYLTLQDRAILATLVNAVKEQQQEIEELKAEIKRMKK